MIVQNIFNSLGLKEEPTKSITETLANYLKDKEIFLILDNCEHLIYETAQIVKMLLSSCAKLKIIATSREVLNCPGEHTYVVPSMSLPDISEDHAPEKITQYESVRLFIEKTLLVNPNFRVKNSNLRALMEICHCLNGIPLNKCNH
ncbi:MAG: hypothetical protein M3R36_15800 [Bacteroidota bacterium]|nr:hypothetical protein [Bacteroidota bacterium]